MCGRSDAVTRELSTCPEEREREVVVVVKMMMTGERGKLFNFSENPRGGI